MQGKQVIWTLTLLGLIPAAHLGAANAAEPLRPNPTPNTAATVQQSPTQPGAVITGRVVGVDQATGVLTLRNGDTKQTIAVGTAPILLDGKLTPINQVRLGDTVRAEQETTPGGNRPLTRQVTITRSPSGPAPRGSVGTPAAGAANAQPTPVTGVVPAPSIRLPIAAPGTVPSVAGAPAGVPATTATGAPAAATGAVAPGVAVSGTGVVTTDGLAGTVVAPGVVAPGVTPGAVPGTPAVGPGTGLTPGLAPQGTPLRAAPAGPVAGTTVAPATGAGVPGAPGVVPGATGVPGAPGVVPGAPAVVPLVAPPTLAAPGTVRPVTVPPAGVRTTPARGAVPVRPVPRANPRPAR